MVQSQATSWQQQFFIVRAAAGITTSDAGSFTYYLSEPNMKKRLEKIFRY